MKGKLKQIIFILFLVIVAVANGTPIEESGYKIEVKIDTLDYEMAYLTRYKDGGFVKIDSVAIQNRSFSFKGSVSLPEVHYIIFNVGKERISVFLENSNISITGTNLKKGNIKIKGSATHDKLNELNGKTDEYDNKLKEITTEYYKAKEKGDTILMKELGINYEKNDSLKNVVIKNYINKNLNSVIAPYLSLKYMMNALAVEEMEKLSDSFSEAIKESGYVKQIKERVAIVKRSAVGQPAPLFTMNDENGNPISLESFKGGYVLVDFWASWCGPCRTENPNVVAAYKKYHEKGFEIFGVSFDANKEKWLDAIKKDNLTWKHVSDLKGWGNAAGKIYGVRGIPHSVLIDKEGIIIAKNLRGEELHKKLEEIFSK